MESAQTRPAHKAGELIARSGFDSAAVAPEDRFDAWRESMARLHDLQPVQEGLCSPRVSARGWNLDGMVLSDLAFSPILYRRRAGRVGDDCLLVRLYREGRARGIYEDTTFETRPGEIHLFDQSPPCRGLTSNWHALRSILIPYRMVEYDPARHPAHIRVAAETGVGRILQSAIESLFEQLPHVRQAEAPALAAVFAGIVKGLLLTHAASAGGSRDFDAVRRVALRRYLEDHLADPDLGVVRLCRAFGASRATIYRDFAEEGGVARYVTRRRLECALRDLAGGPPERGRIRRIAERWGFASPYHFSRVFRKQFDLSPSEVSEIGDGADQPAGPGRSAGFGGPDATPPSGVAVGS